MKRIIFISFVMAVCGFSLFAKEKGSAMEKTTYDLVINGYDWGPGVDKVIVHNGKEIDAKKVNAADFTVETEIKALQWTSWPPKLVDKTQKREVLKAYLCDEKGNEVSKKSSHIALELPVHPDDPFSNPFIYGSDMMNHWQDLYNVTITNGKIGLNVSELGKKLCPLADQFKIGESKTDDVTLHYGLWEPETSASKIPMVIWLHGMGEGGNDPYIALLGNKVVNLITPEVQNSFGSTGAYILAPQVNGFWMQTEIKSNGMEGWISDKSKSTVSYYTKALFNLIEEVVAQNPKIDKNRIYIGGCSNGGYMTMNMIIEYPEYFAAAYPVCQAYPDSRIDDEKLKILANQNIWFTQSKDDKTVNPPQYSIPTVKRLQDLGAKNVHFTLWDTVTDTTGLYKGKDKKAYRYNGHFSWIYTLNNQCEENGEKIFEWLSKQSK